uniref:Putative secreted protein n=1 Tax=Panstrongylus lignarius TaxID=156445 RepID=A0A224XR84_9HEMI
MRAAILILLAYNQLMVITTVNYNQIEVKNELKILKNQLHVFFDKIEHAEEEDTKSTILKQLPGGSFVRPPKVNTTLIKNKLNDLQNNVTKLNEELMNNDHNLADIKERITTLESELERLNRFYEDEDREFKNTLEKFQSTLSGLMLNYNNFLRNNENREKELEKIQLVKEHNEFVEAIKHNYYQLAVIKFSTIQNVTIARDLIKTTYKKVDNMDCFLNFIDDLKDMNKKLLIYKTFHDTITDEHSLIGVCKMFKNRMKLHYDINSNKMPDDLQNIAIKLLAEIDERIEALLYLLTAIQQQDAIVKIRYHKRLFGPADYVHIVIKKGFINMESYMSEGRRTAILSCYPIDCR